MEESRGWVLEFSQGSVFMGLGALGVLGVGEMWAELG